MYEIMVDKELCTGCGECVDICMEEVFEYHDLEPVPVSVEECSGCEICSEVCEQEAIIIMEV